MRVQMKPIKKDEVREAMDQVLFGAVSLVILVWFPIQAAITILRACGIEVGH